MIITYVQTPLPIGSPFITADLDSWWFSLYHEEGFCWALTSLVDNSFFFKNNSWEDSSQAYICYKHILRTFDSGEKNWTWGLGTSSNPSPTSDWLCSHQRILPDSSAFVPSSFNVFPIYIVGNQFDFLNNLSSHLSSCNFVTTNRLSISNTLQISYHSGIWASFSLSCRIVKSTLEWKSKKRCSNVCSMRSRHLSWSHHL